MTLLQRVVTKNRSSIQNRTGVPDQVRDFPATGAGGFLPDGAGSGHPNAGLPTFVPPGAPAMMVSPVQGLYPATGGRPSPFSA